MMQMRPVVQWMAVPVFVLLAAASARTGEQDGRSQLRTVTLGDGVELHYIERGKGVPVVFVHGTLGDYSVWESQLASFASTYHAFTYSRRYNYPNSNGPQPNHSAVIEAADLAAFIKKLNLGQV